MLYLSYIPLPPVLMMLHNRIRAAVFLVEDSADCSDDIYCVCSPCHSSPSHLSIHITYKTMIINSMHLHYKNVCC